MTNTAQDSKTRKSLILSIKDSPVGKPPVVDGRQLSYGWKKATLSVTQLVKHITEGKPIAVAHYKNGHRNKINFLTSTIIVLDVDGNTANMISGKNNKLVPAPLTNEEYEQFINHDIIQKYAFCVIQSFSSETGAFKCRAFFALSEEIVDPDEYTALVSQLMSTLPYTDPSAKDCARAFFGGRPGRPADFIAYNNVLDVAWLRELYMEETRQKVIQQLRRKESARREITEPDLQQVCDALKHIPAQQDYIEWVRILMAIHSAFPGADGVAAAEAWSPGTPGEIEYKFSTFKKNQVTLGTLFHIARRHGYILPEKQETAFDTVDMGKAPERFQTTFINEQFLTKASFQLERTMLIKSPIGSGKTEWIIQSIPENMTILVLSNRRALARELTERFSRTFADFENYEDFADTPDVLSQLPRLVITPNSIHKLLLRNGNLPRIFDFIILDETEQLLDHIAGETMYTNGIHKYYIITEFIKRARYVIGADAHLTRISAEWLANYRNDIRIIENTYTKKRGDMQLFLDKNMLLDNLTRDLKAAKRNKKTIFVATDSKGEAKALHQMLKQRNYYGIVVHADNRSDEKIAEVLEDIDNRVTEYDYFIYSPAIGAGIDIQADIEVVYGIFLNQSIIAEEQFQMLGRARKATRFMCYSAGIDRAAECRGKKLKADIIDNLAEHARRYKLILEWDVEGKACLSLIQDQYTNLFCNFRAKRNYYMNDPQRKFKDRAYKHFQVKVIIPPRPEKDENGKIIEDPATTFLKRALAKARKEIKEYERNLTLTSAPVNDMVYNGAQVRNEVTPEVEFGHRRYTIEAFYNQKIDGKLIEEAEDTVHGGMNRLTNFINLHRHLHQLVESDRGERALNIAHVWRRLDALRISVAAELLSCIFGDRLHTERITDFEDRLELLNTRYEELNAGRILKRRTNSKDTPIKRLRWLLSLFGLRLYTYRNRHTGKKTHGLQVERYRELLALAQTALKNTPDESSIVPGTSLVKFRTAPSQSTPVQHSFLDNDDTNEDRDTPPPI